MVHEGYGGTNVDSSPFIGGFCSSSGPAGLNGILAGVLCAFIRSAFGTMGVVHIVRQFLAGSKSGFECVFGILWYSTDII